MDIFKAVAYLKGYTSVVGALLNYDPDLAYNQELNQMGYFQFI
jgi:hypothetical protein